MQIITVYRIKWGAERRAARVDVVFAAARGRF